jgi:hypothetical protein
VSAVNHGRPATPCYCTEPAPIEPAKLPSEGELDLVHVQLDWLVGRYRAALFGGRREVPSA